MISGQAAFILFALYSFYKERTAAPSRVENTVCGVGRKSSKTRQAKYKSGEIQVGNDTFDVASANKTNFHFAGFADDR